METSAKVKFENDDDFINGSISMGKMLDKWKASAEDKTRSYEMKMNSEELSLDIFLKVC